MSMLPIDKIHKKIVTLLEPYFDLEYNDTHLYVLTNSTTILTPNCTIELNKRGRKFEIVLNERIIEFEELLAGVTEIESKFSVTS